MRQTINTLSKRLNSCLLVPMSKLTASISIIMLVIFMSSFQRVTRKAVNLSLSPTPKTDSLSNCEHDVYEYFYTSSSRFTQYCDTLYTTLFDQGKKPSRKVFDYAMKGYAYFLNQDMLAKKDILAFIDYSLSSNTKRLWVIDLKQVSVLYHELVAHGRNTGEEYANVVPLKRAANG